MPQDKDFWHLDWDEELSESITPSQEAILDRIAKEVVDRQMSVPVLIFLETVRPLNWMSSQVLLFFEPITAWFFGLKELIDLRRALDKRESIPMLMDKIQNSQEEHREKLAIEKAEKKKSKSKNNPLK